MKVSALNFFRATARTRSLVVAFLFAVANIVTTLGVFVPSASAALVWEDIVVADGPNGTTRTSGAVPKGSGLDLFTLSSADLSAYSSFKLSFDYENSNQSITSLNLFYWLYESHIAGDSIGSAINFSPSESVSASSGHIEATFSGSVPSTNRLRLMIDDVNRNISNNPSDRLDITNIRFQGQKDDGTVAAPAVPTLTAPADGALVSYDDIQNGITKLQFTSETGVAKNHVVLSGIYYNQVQNNETPFEYEITTGTYGASGNIALNNLASKNSASYDFIVGKTYTWKVRSSFSDIAYNAAEGWGAWSTRTFTVTAGDEVVVPTAPVLVSPTDSATVHYDDIQDGTATLAFTPDAGVQKNHLVITGTFDETNPGHESNVSSAVSTVELNKFAKQGGLIDFIPGNTYTWKVRSSFTNAELQGEEQQWGDWSGSYAFTVAGEDGDEVIRPAAPTILSPANGAEVEYSDIQGGSAKFEYEPAAEASETHIYVTGTFWDTKDGVEEDRTRQIRQEGEEIAINEFGNKTEDHDFIIGKTYTWKVRSTALEEPDMLIDDNWGEWSDEYTFTVVDSSQDDDDDEVPAAPTLKSPANNGQVFYDAIHDYTADLTYAPVSGVANSHISLTGDFGAGVETIHRESTSGEIPLEEFIDDNDFIVGNTYTWAVRSSYELSSNYYEEEHWGDWSVERTFKVVAPTPGPEEGGDKGDGTDAVGGNGGPGITPISPSTLIGGQGASLAAFVPQTSGEVLAQQDSDILSDTTEGESADEPEGEENESEESVVADDEEGGRFLLLGWWWLIIITAAGGVYLALRTPTES